MDWRLSHDRLENAHALTVFAAIVHGREEEARTVIESLPRGAESPLARLDQLHFSRLQIIDRLVYQGAPQKPDTLKSAYLVFTASFDGALEPFLAAIRERLPAEADSWWGCCVGYPGVADLAAFTRYIRHNRIRTNLFGVSAPKTTLPDIRESVELRDRLVEFAISAQGLDARELQERFRQTFADVA
ncbi:MAG TPA: hypothetical protein VFB35_00140 [Gaiellaceae bacterium]|nr:hypothetical protein [Gaiellaceae bacterium]